MRFIIFWCLLLVVGVTPFAFASVDFGAELRAVTASQAKSLCGYGTAGVAVTNTTAGGLANEIGLRENDVILTLNDTRILKVADVTKAIDDPNGQITITFARNGRKHLNQLYEKNSDSSKLISFVGDEGSDTADILRNAGFKVDVTPNVPSDLSKYAAVVIENERACNPGLAKRLKDYAKEGGGVILQGLLPGKLTENYWNLSNIADWFGVSRLGNDNIEDLQLICSINKPVGLSFRIGDRIAAFRGKQPFPYFNPKDFTEFATIVASWQGEYHLDNGVSIFTHTYGDKGGRIFYTFKPSDPNYPSLGKLFIGGVKWAAKIDAEGAEKD